MRFQAEFLLCTLLSSILPCCFSQSIEFPQNSSPKPAADFEGLRECPQGSDKLLNECIKLILDENRKFLSNGVPQIGLQALDPLYVKEFPVPVTPSIKYIWRNVVVRGFTNYSRGDVKVNTKKKTIDFRYAYPLLRVTADYERGGQFLWIELKGKGKVQLDIKNYQHYQANGTFYLKVEYEDGEPILRIRDINLKNSADSIRSHVPNLVNSGFWGQVMNDFMNSNALMIYDDYVRPKLKSHMEKYMMAHSTLPKIFSATYFINN